MGAHSDPGTADGDVDWDVLGLAFLGLRYSSSTHFFFLVLGV